MEKVTLELKWTNNISMYPDFYIQMFGDKTINKSLGLCVCKDDCDEWLLAVQGDILLGFSGYKKDKVNFHLKRSFVFKEFRGFGIYKMMLDLRIEKAKETNCSFIYAQTTQQSKNEFIKRDFFAMKMYKKFVKFRKPL